MTERLIVLPGWGFDSAALQPLAEALGAEVQVELHALPALADAQVDVWLDELDARLPQDCWLAGWSLGGMLATALAARRGVRCRGLISLASNACFVAREGWPQAMPGATFAAFRQGCAAQDGATFKRFAMLCAQGSEDARGLSKRLQACLSHASGAQLLAGLDVLASLDNRAALSAFAGPQLHLLAERDALLPAAAGEALLALLPCGEVDVLEDCGHAFVLEQPQAVAALIGEFIREAVDA